MSAVSRTILVLLSVTLISVASCSGAEGSQVTTPTPVLTNFSRVMVMAPAVAQTSEGTWFGVASWVTVYSEPGEGRIFVDTFPLTQIDTQGSARLAAEAAASVAGVDLSEVDIYIVIRSDSAVIGGPSAGGVLSTAILASLLNETIEPGVVMTGTINPDGSIGPIGGVLQKAEAASSVGAGLFLVPSGQTVSTVNPGSLERIDVAKYAEENLNLTVKEVFDIREAAKWLIGVEIKLPGSGEEVDLEEYNRVMGEASGEMIDASEELYEEASSSFESTTMTFDQRDYLKMYLDDSGLKLEEAGKARTDETYYSSASLAFQSKINSTFVINALVYFEKRERAAAKRLIEEAERVARDSIDLVNETSFTSITGFECFAAAERRAHEAISLIEDAWEDYYRSSLSGDVLEALKTAAYIKQRAQSAIWWSSLCEEFPGDDDINRTVLKDLAQEYIADLKYLDAYAASVGSGNFYLLGLAEELLQEAIDESAEGAHSAAILDALRARSYLNAHLELGSNLVSLNEELANLLDDRVERERERAVGSIATSRQYGVNPILALSHVENGENYAREAEAMSSPSQSIPELLNALLEFKNARLIAEMSPVISQRLGEGIGDNIPPVLEPYRGETVSGGYGSTEMILVATAFLGGGVLIGLYIGRRREQGPQVYRMG